MTRAWQSLEDALGYLLRPEDEQSVTNFNEMTPEMVEEMRNLGSRLLATEYLRFYVSNTEAYDEFVDDVLAGTVSEPSTWGRRDVVVFPSDRVSFLVTHESEEILAPMLGVNGERWFRVVPTVRDWWGFPGYAGAPAVIVRDAPYWFELNGASVYNTDSDPVEALPGDIEVTLRRWVASRVARDCQRREPGKVDSISGVCRELQIEESDLSQVGRKAITGLLRSGWPHQRPQPDATRSGHMMDEEQLPPGYRNEDEHFVGEDKLDS